MLNQNEDNWRMLYFILFAIFIVNIALVLATLKATPESAGMVVDLEDLPPGEQENGKPVTICEAIKMPEVLLYGSSYFCTKLVWINYLSWLPTYISSVYNYDELTIVSLCKYPEYGTLAGGAVVGFISDRFFGKRAITGAVAIMGALAVQILLVLKWNSSSKEMLSFLLFLIGLLLGGVNHIWSVVCGQDIGSKLKKQGKGSSIATVVGIIDGIGSLGGCFGAGLIGVT